MSSRPIISLRVQKDIKDALARNGYDTVQDVLSAIPTSLAQELNLTVPEVDDLIQQIQNPHTQNSHVPLTQSAAVIMKSARTFSTHWEPLDELLEGGLVQGHILELSGPPGSPKENIAIDIVSSFLDAGEEVLFVGSPWFRGQFVDLYAQTNFRLSKHDSTRDYSSKTFGTFDIIACATLYTDFNCCRSYGLSSFTRLNTGLEIEGRIAGPQLVFISIFNCS